MARIHELKINNFRGIKSLTIKSNNKKFICLLGRGDSGKTTILESIRGQVSTFDISDLFIKYGDLTPRMLQYKY